MSSDCIRVCPACQTGYIMSFDLHARCEACLGPEHAGLALTPQAACPYCKLLPEKERRRRADAFADAADEAFPVAEAYALDDAIALFADGSESDDSAPGSPSPSGALPPLRMEGLDAEEMPATAEIPTSAITALPAVGALVKDLPQMIARAAALRNLTVPPAQEALPLDEMAGSYASAHAAKRDPVWPRFPAIIPYLSGAGAEPGKLKAPVSTYSPITKVEGLTDSSFPPVPALDPSLTSLFGVRANVLSGRRPALPSSRDQLTARFTDRSHQCAYQVKAAANNISLMAFAITRLAAEPDHLAEHAIELGNFASAILNLCASTAVCAARISAWQQLIQRNMWLHLSSSIPEAIKKELLECPISSNGLFGPHLQVLVDHMQKASEDAEKIKRHVARARRSSGSWRDRRDQRSGQRRPQVATTVASQPPQRSAPATFAAPPPAPPSFSEPAPAAHRGPRQRRAAPTWSNPPVPVPPRKQPRRQ